MPNGLSLAVITGNITRDPEQRSERLLTFSVAVNRREKDSEGNWGDSAHYFDVKILGNRASSLGDILRKGQAITVQGDLVQERWEKDGQKRSAVRILAREVVLHGRPPESEGNGDDDDDDPLGLLG